MSALRGDGMAELRALVEERLLSSAMQALTVAVAPADGARLAWLYRHGTVTAVGGWCMVLAPCPPMCLLALVHPCRSADTLPRFLPSPPL